MVMEIKIKQVGLWNRQFRISENNNNVTNSSHLNKNILSMYLFIFVYVYLNQIGDTHFDLIL